MSDQRLTNQRAKKRPRVLFVTNELYPQKKGGIGRLIYNLLIDNRDRGFPADIHILLTPSDIGDTSYPDSLLVQEIGNLATLYFCPPSLRSFEPLGALFQSSGVNDWGLYKAYETPFYFYLSIRELLRRGHGPFDIIEFPDYGGWAYATLEAKRSGLAFQNTEIVVRLHSTLGLITKAEPYYHSPSAMMGWQQDMERHCLRYGDRIIGHLTPIIRENAAHYGFGDDWIAKTVLNCPPITLTADEKTAAKSAKSASTDEQRFVFSSRLQPFKRPDIFIRAAILFMEQNPAFRGDFWAVSYGWDSDYINWLRGSIPFAMRGQIKILDDISPEDRLKALSGAITIIPSIYESLCLFAYEAGLMGNRVILNAACPAFGDDTPWHSGVNCLTFDGSPHDLAAQMAKSLDWQPTEPVIVPAAEQPYWLEYTEKESVTLPPVGQSLSIAVVHYGYKSHQEAAGDIRRRLDITRDQPGVVRYAALQTSVDDKIDPETLPYPVLPLSGRSLLPSDFAKNLKALEQDLILLLPNGAEMDEAFVSLAQTSLKANADLTGLAGFTEVIDGQGRAAAIKPVATGCRTGALTGDAGLDVGLVFRRTVLDHISFDDNARQDWYRVFARQLILADIAVAAVPDIAVRVHTDALQHQEKRQIANTLLASSGLLPDDIASFGLKMDIAPKQTLESLKPKQRHLTFFGGHRIAPSQLEAGFEPVQFRKDNNDLLVHAVNDETVVARLPIEASGQAVGSITVQMMHKGKDQLGIDAVLWANPVPLTAGEARAEKVLFKSPTERLDPKDKKDITLTLPTPVEDIYVYVAVKLPDGADQARAWSVVTGLYVAT